MAGGFVNYAQSRLSSITDIFKRIIIILFYIGKPLFLWNAQKFTRCSLKHYPSAKMFDSLVKFRFARPTPYFGREHDTVSFLWFIVHKILSKNELKCCIHFISEIMEPFILSASQRLIPVICPMFFDGTFSF